MSATSWPWTLALACVTALNIATFAPPWMVVLPGLGFVRAASITQVSTAFSLIMPGGAPVGMAASYAALRSWGFPGRRVGLAVTVTGIWNQLSVFAFPVVAVVLLAVQGGAAGDLWPVAAIGVLLFAGATLAIGAVLSRPSLTFLAGELVARLAGRINRLRRTPASGWGGAALLRFRAETLGLLQRRGLALILATLANQLTGYLLLELSVRSVGITQTQVSVAETFAAWSIGRLLVSIPLTPGGIGFVELGLAATLIGFGGPHAQVVAAVLVYRALSVFPTLVLGLVALSTWRFQMPRTRPTASSPPTTAVRERRRRQDSAGDSPRALGAAHKAFGPRCGSAAHVSGQFDRISISKMSSEIEEVLHAVTRIAGSVGYRRVRRRLYGALVVHPGRRVCASLARHALGGRGERTHTQQVVVRGRR